MTYRLCKTKIEKKQFKSKEKMQEMLDVFYAGERINTNEYEELTAMLDAQ